MGKLVNVVLPGNKVVTVPEEDAQRITAGGTGRYETDQEETGRAVAAANEQRAQGFAQGAKTIAEGALDTVTGGGYGKIAGAISPDYGEDLANRGQYRPGMRAAGELLGMVIPTGAPGFAAKAGEAVTAKVAGSLANPLTRGASFVANGLGRAAEGMILGAGAHVAETNVTGDPVTVEGTLASMGIGAVLNVGMGAAADKISALGTKAEGKTAEILSTKEDIKLVKEARASELFSKPPDSWETLKSAIKKSADDQQTVVKEAAKEAKKYTDYIANPNRIASDIKKAESARNEIQARLNRTKYAKAIDETHAAFDEANTQLGKLKGKADDLLSSTEDWPTYVDKIDDAIKAVRNRYAPEGWEPVYKPKLQGYEGEVGADGLFTRGEAMHTATKKMPISKEQDELLKSFSERASQIRQLHRGGTKLRGNRWVKDASAKPNPQKALEEIHKLRADFAAKYDGVKFPDPPELPKTAFPQAGPRPTSGQAGQMDELRTLSQTSKALSDGIGAARIKMKAGDYEGAAQELRALRERAATAGHNDLVLPEVPMKMEAPPLPDPIKVPKDFRELYRMGPERAQRISDLIAKDQATSEAFGRLANELGINQADGLAGLNARLGKYIGAEKRLVDAARKEAEEDGGDGFLSLLRRGAKRFARVGVGRTMDRMAGGGVLGAAGYVVGHEGAGYAMNAVEDSINGALVRGKLTATSVLNTMFSKAAPPMSKALKELGPITAYLQQNALSGEPDGTQDIQEGANKRIKELVAANATAPDAAYIAVQSLLGHKSDVAWKFHQKIVGDMQYLVQTAPKDPGIAQHMLDSYWTPSHEEATAYAYRIEAVMNPLKAIARGISGDWHPAQIEALWARSPALMQLAAEEFSFSMHSMKDVSIEQASNYSHVFRTPITGLMDPNVGLTIQGVYMRSPEQSPNAGQTGGASKATGNPVGRPAAVQSSVAGSSVSGLLSQ